MRMLSMHHRIVAGGGGRRDEDDASSARSKRCSVAAALWREQVELIARERQASGPSRLSERRTDRATDEPGGAENDDAGMVICGRGSNAQAQRCSLARWRRYAEGQIVETGCNRRTPIEYPVGIKHRLPPHDTCESGRVEGAKLPATAS